MTSKLRFKTEGASLMPTGDAAIVNSGEDLTEILAAAVIDTLSTSLFVTVGEVSMFFDAWRNPQLWAADWAAKLAVEEDDVEEAVWALLNAAVEQS
jgi:hypothetical protein